MALPLETLLYIFYFVSLGILKLCLKKMLTQVFMNNSILIFTFMEYINK